MNILLVLKKGSEEKILDLNMMKPSSARQIRRAMSEKWELVDCKGDNPEIVAFIKNEVAKYQANREGYKASPKEIVKLGTSIIKPKGKLHLSKRQLLMARFRKQKDE